MKCCCQRSLQSVVSPVIHNRCNELKQLPSGDTSTDDLLMYELHIACHLECFRAHQNWNISTRSSRQRSVAATARLQLHQSSVRYLADSICIHSSLPLTQPDRARYSIRYLVYNKMTTSVSYTNQTTLFACKVYFGERVAKWDCAHKIHALKLILRRPRWKRSTHTNTQKTRSENARVQCRAR